jgi:hypothetical protein
MTKTNYLFSGILAAAIVFAGCSSQPKYTAFGGGWGMEKNKSFQNAQKSTSITSTQKSTNYDEIVVLEENKITPSAEATSNKESKTNNIKNHATVKNLVLAKSDDEHKISIKKPSTWKASNLFSKKKKVNSGGGSDTAGWGIAAFACSFVGLFVLGILFGILGIVFGAIGINKSLKGLAIAGLILGVVDVIAFFILLAMFV